MKIAMIGVGKLGQDCAEVMAEYHDVIGYDIEMRSPANFSMASSIREAITDKELIFIAVPTPHFNGYGGEEPTSHKIPENFDLSIVISTLQEINNYVNSNQIVVLISTVLPGSCRNTLKEFINNATFIYNPYLIAMGTTKHDMVNPEMVIIGTELGKIDDSVNKLIDFYKPLMQNNPRFEIGTWDEAEAIKIFYNTFISTKVAFVNMIQDVAEINGHMDVDVVTNALSKSTYRITGPAYMKAGMGDGGACHPRDNIALRWLSTKYDLGYDLFSSIMTSREVQAKRLAKKCLEYGKNITIIGKAYKPKVPYTHGSSSLLVAHYISEMGGTVHFYDKNTGDTDLKLDWTEVYMIGYWDEWFDIEQITSSAYIIDPWRVSDTNKNKKIIHYGNTKSRNSLYSKEPYRKYSLDSQEDMKRNLLKILPEFKNVENEVYFIYSGCHKDYSILRPSDETLQDDILEALRTGKKYLVFHCEMETIILSIIDKIHRCLTNIKHLINFDNVYFVTGAVSVKDGYEKYCQENNVSIRMKIIETWFFEWIAKDSHGHLQYAHGEYQTQIHKSKLFLSYNKMPREHRIVLIEKLLKKDLLHNSYYSFYADQMEIESFDSNKFPLLKSIKDKFPIRLGNDGNLNPVKIVPEDYNHFDNSLFSLVTETIFYSDFTGKNHTMHTLKDCLFFSEKIFKPIIMQHPFILVSRPGSLKKLRERGYKTFAGIIDESYDEEYDDDKRMESIVNEVQRLSRMGDLEVLDFKEKIKPIVEWNKINFYQDKSYSDFKLN
jgi:UDPglucose 6-dehydrogenase